MQIPRSYLFVPGHRPERFSKAASSGADRIIIDLEDAVGPDDKDFARQQAADWFGGGGGGLLRINAMDTPWFRQDLAAVAGYPDIPVMVPKADAESLRAAADLLPSGRPLIALVETVEGLVGIHAAAAVQGVTRLAFGNLDFGADARIPGEGPVLDPARFQIAIASRRAGLAQPIDGVTVDFRNEDTLKEDVLRARSLGFTAKLCIHPRQVDAVNAGFAPSAEEIAWAERIVQAIEDSAGAAVQVDGKMVDKPMVERAKEILATEVRGASSTESAA